MTADIVVGGLGGDGPVVTGGLGLSGAPDLNAMRAVLHGSGALSATLTAAGSPDIAATLNGSSALTATLTDGNAIEERGKPGGRRYWGASLTPPPLSVSVGALSATLVGTSTMTADLDFTIDFDDELRQLMLLGIV